MLRMYSCNIIIQMSTQTDQLYEKNRKQRQKMLMLIKNRAENIVNRPSPFARSSQRVNPVPPSFDILKQYQSNKSSQPQHGHSHTSSGPQFEVNAGEQNKSFDYNSTLFKYLNQDSHSNILQTMIADKTSQLMFNNGSALSGQSSINERDNTMHNIDNNQLLKDNSLLNKIDQLLNTRKKHTTPNKNIKNVYQQYLDKKSMTNSSGGFSNNSSLINQHQGSTLSKALTSNELANKLKTIQQQRATLTIDRSQDEKQNNRNKMKEPPRANKPNAINSAIKDHSPVVNKNTIPKPVMKKPPLAPTLASQDAIQRHKKKIQQTMQQIRDNDMQEKDSLMFDISDISSDQESNNKNITQKGKQEQQKIMKKTALKQQKQKLMQELSTIQKQLQQLQQQEQQEQS